MKISYDSTQLMKCAQYIFTHNSAALSWGHPSFLELGNEMLYQAKRHAKSNAKLLNKNVSEKQRQNEWTDYISTGGYIISFSHEDEDELIHADFLIDPIIGIEYDERNLVTEELEKI